MFDMYMLRHRGKIPVVANKYEHEKSPVSVGNGETHLSMDPANVFGSVLCLYKKVRLCYELGEP